MLVLSRKQGEEILIGDDVRLVVQRIGGNRVTIAIDAPSDVSITRSELLAFVSDLALSDRAMAAV
jgi:carbon storage regulator